MLYIRFFILSIIIMVSSLSSTLAKSLTIYSPQGDERAVWIAEQAQAAGHDMIILTAGGSELFDRILAEKAHPQADVVFGLVDVSMATLKSEGLFQPYEPRWAKELPKAYRDDADHMVYKFWQTPIVIAYNSDVMSAEEAPRSWLDLIKPIYKERYVIGPSTWQTVKVFLVGIFAHFLDEKGEVTEEGWDFMRKFYDNAIVVDSGDAKTAAYINGEAVLDLNWLGGVYRLAKTIGYKPEMVNTEGGTPFITEGIAIMAGTDQLEQAKAFVDWFGSPEFMSAYAKKFEQVPVHPDAIANAPKAIQEKARMLTPQSIDWSAITPRIDGWLQRIELEIK